MNAVTFAERFCAKHGLAPEEFLEAALGRALYPRVRMLRAVRGLKDAHFASDREFISRVGRIKALHEFELEAYAYTQDFRNGAFLRRTLKLRVSVRRLQALVRRTWREGSGQSFTVAS